MTSRKFTRDERVAIGELLKAATVCATSKNAGVSAMAAMLAERAANIWRGESSPYVATLADVRAFAKAWDVTTRAAFNPKKVIRVSGAPPEKGRCPVRPPLDGSNGSPMRFCQFAKGHARRHSWE